MTDEKGHEEFGPCDHLEHASHFNDQKFKWFLVTRKHTIPMQMRADDTNL